MPDTLDIFSLAVGQARLLAEQVVRACDGCGYELPTKALAREGRDHYCPTCHARHLDENASERAGILAADRAEMAARR